MYSQGVFCSPKLIESICIVGITDFELDLLKDYFTFEKEKTKPEVLFAIPNSKATIMQATFDFAFPNGMEISLFEEKPKIYSILLTNEKGTRSYLYILLFYDKYRLNEEDLDQEVGKSSITSVSSLSRTFYCPIAICILSYINNLSFFRNLLLEFHRIISFNTDIIKKQNCENQILNYQKIELMNYLYYSIELVKPPPKARLLFNLRFSSIEYITQSKLEIPSNEYTIGLLFECLEISSIIKLFLALLFEKNIILIGNQNITLFSICDALISLIFPFKWDHSCIPLLSYDQLVYLENPTPYIMGVHSSCSDIHDLKKSFPSHIICDIGTSDVYGTNPANLPSNEEAKIRSKLLLLKNKKKNNYDDIDVDTSSILDEEIEDISPKHSFAENVHAIFFRVFRNNLANIKEGFISNNVFNSQKFLNSFDNEEHKIFFGKLINTLAFEHFFLTMQYLDDSNSRQFNYICQNIKNTNSNIKQKYYTYQHSLYHHSLLFTNSNLDNTDEIRKDYIETVTDLEKIQTSINSNGTNLSSSNQQLPFYHKHGFLSFITSYRGLRPPSVEIQNEIKAMIKDIKDNTIKISHYSSKAFQLPNDDSSQFYLIIISYLQQYSFAEHSKLIYDLFIKSFTKNHIEFPRNFFYILLNKYTHHDLKQMAVCSHKYISKSVLCHLRKIEKVKYKTMVISHDSDESSYENEIDLDNEDLNDENTTLSSSVRPRIKTVTSKCYNTTNFPRHKLSTIRLGNNNKNNIDNTTNTPVNQPYNPKQLQKRNTVKISLYKIDDRLNYDHNSMADLKKIKVNNDPHIKAYSIEKDPIALSETICVKLFTLLSSCKIQTITNENFDVNYLRDLSKTDGFIDIKKLILSLSKISLLKISQNANYYFCFWLNLYNFLTIFSIIYKCESMTNYFEWYRFRKNAYFTIGNCDISLYEIENVILRSDEVSKRIYGEVCKNEIQHLPKLEDYDPIINFGITIPTISSPALRIYFPNNFAESLRVNSVEYFSRMLAIDFNNFVITIPEYLTWIEPRFIDRIKLYHASLPLEIINYITENHQLVSYVEKYNWKINFANFQSVEVFRY